MEDKIKNMNVIIKNKTLTQHFVGKLQKGYFPFEGKDMWFVSCISYGGGGTKINPLDAIDIKRTTKSGLIKSLKSLAKRGKYRISFTN